MAKAKSAYSIPTKKGKLDTHIFVVWVDNEAGVLARVVGLFSGRGYNIESLAVAEVDATKNISRITIVTTGTPQVIDQIKLQLKKLVPVHKVADFKREDKKVIFKEMALLKVVGNKKKIEKTSKNIYFQLVRVLYGKNTGYLTKLLGPVFFLVRSFWIFFGFLGPYFWGFLG